MSTNSPLDDKEYWRSLGQLADTPEFREILHREFPEGASEMKDPITRRKFMTLMGASLAFAGLASCRRPVEKIIPYVTAPEEIIPGVAQYYATTMPLGLNAYGLLVESHEGRPTKIEGNPKHPSTLGRSNLLIQASILGLYDPDRSKRVLQAGPTDPSGQERNWEDFVTFWRGLLDEFQARQGNGLAILSESFASPTLAELMRQLKSKMPQAVWATYEPDSDENIFDGLQIATGRPYQPIYDFQKAEVILSLDADFLIRENNDIRNSLGFTNGRRVLNEEDGMNRLYVAESSYSNTGAMADHRLRIPSGQIGAFAGAIAAELKSQGLRLEDNGLLSSYADHHFDKDWIRIAAGDLLKAGKNSLIVVGKRQPPALHALAFTINSALGNIGNTIRYQEVEDTAMPNSGELNDLVSRMNNGQINTLVILGSNPVYNAPVDLEFGNALKKISHTIHLSPYLDESSNICEWHIPQAHYLETWGDARAADGTLSIIQPLIEPLYGGKSAFEMLDLIVNGADTRGYDIIRERWQKILSGDFESNWAMTLNAGLLADSAKPPVIPQAAESAIWGYVNANPLKRPTPDTNNLEINFYPSCNVYDGRFANNGWLQELPNNITRLTWDNAAIISPKTAGELRLSNTDVVSLNYAGRSIETPIWILPGQADNSVALDLGYGRKLSGLVGNNTGFDVYPLRLSQALHFGDGLTIKKTGQTYLLANTQEHHSLEGRPIIREATLAFYKENPEFATEMVEAPPNKSLWDEHKYGGPYQWGMAIDLNTCIGCHACTIACQSENNIPIVGKEQVHNSRAMHWLRIDRYFAGDVTDPEIQFQPMMCQHCEMAPCEQVCPVNASVHDSEGLNLQVYNRCIGTRYCSNNCPYKVRRFNFFNYTRSMPEPIRMTQNPDVTVRGRGVMEKCTYCLQRIVEAKDKARQENRTVQDGELITACAQTCPVDAIVFGNLADPESRVSHIKKQNRNYQVLAEYNTRPRTSYLAKLRNPNQELELLEKNRV